MHEHDDGRLRHLVLALSYDEFGWLKFGASKSGMKVEPFMIHAMRAEVRRIAAAEIARGKKIPPWLAEALGGHETQGHPPP